MVLIDKIGYTRVSTRDQDPDNQVRLLMAEGIPEDYIFVDKGISGTVPAEKRPGFQRAMAYVNAHKDEVKSIYVFEVSRLGRTFVETATLMSTIEKRGIMVWSISPKEGFMRIEDSSIRELVMMIMLWVAQHERNNLIERTKAGMDRAEAEGKIIGRPRAKIDWEYVNRRRTEGASWCLIADEIGYTAMTIFRERQRKGML